MAMAAKGYALKGTKYVKADRVLCDICLEYFTPQTRNQKRHNKCTKEAERLASARHEKKRKHTPHLIKRRALNMHKTLQKRICLGELCDGEKTFMSEGPFNRVCERCEAAMAHIGGRFVKNT